MRNATPMLPFKTRRPTRRHYFLHVNFRPFSFFTRTTRAKINPGSDYTLLFLCVMLLHSLAAINKTMAWASMSMHTVSSDSFKLNLIFDHVRGLLLFFMPLHTMHSRGCYSFLIRRVGAGESITQTLAVVGASYDHEQFLVLLVSCCGPFTTEVTVCC